MQALYGQLDSDLSVLINGLGGTAGYRYTWDKAFRCVYSADYSLSNGGTPPTPGSLGFLPTQNQCETGSFTPDSSASPGTTLAQNFSVKSKKGTYTLGINWQATPGLLLYAPTRRGYRAGGFTLPTLDAPFPTHKTFWPEN